MTLRHTEIDARNRDTDALAERLELKIHAIAWVLTATVLAMRLVAGRQDVTPDASTWEDSVRDQAESLTPARATASSPSAGTMTKPAR